MIIANIYTNVRTARWGEGVTAVPTLFKMFPIIDPSSSSFLKLNTESGS
jgi:hypothetical protein